MSEHTATPWRIAEFQERDGIKYVIQSLKSKNGYHHQEDIGFYKGRKKDAHHMVNCVNAMTPSGAVTELLEAAVERVFSPDRVPNPNEDIRLGNAIYAVRQLIEEK